MNPTTTEHDFRFPRRPDGRGGGNAYGHRQQRSNDLHDTSLDQLQYDMDKTNAAASTSLLGTALFPSLESAADSEEGEDATKSDDSLPTQMWKFFARTKQQLPNQQRMENLAWRMMSLEMRKQGPQGKKRCVFPRRKITS